MIAIRFHDPTIPDDLVISENGGNGYVLRTIDLGDADTRQVVEDAPDADGTIDDTAYVGARPVTIAVTLTTVDTADTMHTLLTRIRRYTNPRLRPTLFVQEADGPELAVTVRRGQVDAPVGLAHYRNVTLQWVAPSGVLESAAETVVPISAGGEGAEVGRLYPLIHPRIYPASDPLGSIVVTNAGNADAYPLIRIYGPCTDPTLINDRADRSLVFDGLEIDPGEFVEIDTRRRTIRYNANPADSRYGTLSFPASRWWSLAPGESTIRFVPATSSAPSLAELVYRHTYL